MLAVVRPFIRKSGILCVFFAVGLLSLTVFGAEQPKDMAPPAPVPAPITTAKKVFIANAPGENLPASLGGPERTYNEFYAAMKSWGRYELVAAPADADVIFELSFSNSLAGVGGTSSMGCSSSTDQTVRLVILDNKMRVPLWWFAEQIKQEKLFGRRPEALNRSFVSAIAALVDDTKKLVGPPTVAPDGEKK